MKSRSLSCACLFAVSTLLLAAPAMAIKPAGANAQAHADFCAGFAALVDQLAPAFAQLAGGRP